jgi:hypothetical protein
MGRPSGPRRVEVGAVLEHRRRGEVLARCEVADERDFRYAGRSYPSLNAAKCAAAADLGLKMPETLNAWHFWGVERRDQSAFAVARSDAGG